MGAAGVLVIGSTLAIVSTGLWGWVPLCLGSEIHRQATHAWSWDWASKRSHYVDLVPRGSERYHQENLHVTSSRKPTRGSFSRVPEQVTFRSKARVTKGVVIIIIFHKMFNLGPNLRIHPYTFICVISLFVCVPDHVLRSYFFWIKEISNVINVVIESTLIIKALYVNVSKDWVICQIKVEPLKIMTNHAFWDLFGNAFTAIELMVPVIALRH